MSLHLRLASMDDAEIVLQWRNDVTTRNNSFSKEIIDLESHKRWFKGKLDDKSCFIYMMTDDDERVGQIRIDQVDDIGEISYMIAPSARRKGYGKRIISLCESMIPKQIRVLMGMVEEDNEASKKCFIGNGFAEFSGGGIACYIKTVRAKGDTHYES